MPTGSTLGKVAKKGLINIIYNTFCKDIGKKVVSTTVENTLTSSITGLAKLVVHGYTNIFKSLTQ